MKSWLITERDHFAIATLILIPLYGAEMTISDTIARIKEYGWAVIEGIIPDDAVGGVRDSIIATVEEARSASDPEENRIVRGSLINRNQSFAPYLSDPRIIKVAETLWGKHVKITITTPVVLFPGGNPQGFHSDWPFNQKHAVVIEAPYPDTPFLLTVIFMLSAFTPDNGATRLVPGSHRIPNNWSAHYGEDNRSPHQSEVRATGEAGSVLIFDSRLWHAPAINSTDRPRAGVTVRYAPWWFNVNPLKPGFPEREDMLDAQGNQESNIVYPLPAGVFASLPEDVKPFLRHYLR